MLRRQVELHTDLSVELKVQRNVVVQSLALAKRVVKVEELHHVYTIGLLQQEDLVDVFKHDLVVVRLAVQLAKIAVEVKTVVATRNHHWQVLDAAHDFACKLTNVGSLNDFLVEEFSCSHLLIIVARFLLVLGLFVLLVLVSFLPFLFFLFCPGIELVVENVESHLTEDVPATCLFASKKPLNENMVTYSASCANSSATSLFPLADDSAMSLYLRPKQRCLSTWNSSSLSFST